jgi:hypothetical protein
MEVEFSKDLSKTWKNSTDLVNVKINPFSKIKLKEKDNS